MDLQHLYSFTATFEDGTQIVHDKEGSDESTRFKGKTLFTDVQFKAGQLDYKNSLFDKKPELLEEMNKNKTKLVSFVLHNDKQSVGVDLRDGHFEINRIPFFQHRPDLEPYKDFRVIYYRTVLRTLNQVSGEEVAAGVAAYSIGWQTNDENGGNVQRTITI